jgi:hypothetical protein
LIITTASTLPTGQVNAGYSQAVAAGGGNPPYTKWTISRIFRSFGASLPPTKRSKYV